MCKNLAERLNAIRRERALSVSEFTEVPGIARSTLPELLRGTGNPRADTIELIAANLGMAPVWLLSAQQEAPYRSDTLSPHQIHQALALLEHLEKILGEYQ